MAGTQTMVANEPVWVDLSTSDAAAARGFYAKVFGWDVEVTTDPQYGGYAMARVGGEDAAGIGPAQPGAPTAWSVYIGTDDAEALGQKVTAAGGRVIVGSMQVGDAGRMAVFQDPAGAFISAWQPGTMDSVRSAGPGTFGWAELSARGLERDIPFYEQVFGWTHRTSDMGGGRSYTEFLLDGRSIAGAMEMPEMVPAEVPGYWLAYFNVEDVDATFQAAKAAGARELTPPMDFAGGRFAVLSDPQGAAFGILKMNPRG